MTASTFRLAGLLRLREENRDRRRVELAQAQAADAEIKRRQEELEECRHRLMSQCRQAAAPGPIDLDELVACRGGIETVMTRQEQLAEQRGRAVVEVEHRRQSLVDADREVRAIEKLEEKLRDQCRREAERRETQSLDEWADRAAN